MPGSPTLFDDGKGDWPSFYTYTGPQGILQRSPSWSPYGGIQQVINPNQTIVEAQGLQTFYPSKIFEAMMVLNFREFNRDIYYSIRLNNSPVGGSQAYLYMEPTKTSLIITTSSGANNVHNITDNSEYNPSFPLLRTNSLIDRGFFTIYMFINLDDFCLVNLYWGNYLEDRSAPIFYSREIAYQSQFSLNINSFTYGAAFQTVVGAEADYIQHHRFWLNSVDYIPPTPTKRNSLVMDKK